MAHPAGGARQLHQSAGGQVYPVGRLIEVDEIRDSVEQEPARSVVLREAVEVPRRTTDSFRTLWQLKISDPLALYVLARKVKSGDLSQVEVSYAVEGRGGPAPVKISRERMPLSDFLNIFGLSLQDVKNYLDEATQAKNEASELKRQLFKAQQGRGQ